MRTNLSGYIFAGDPVSDGVKRILGTTDILSGSFSAADADRASSPSLSRTTVFVSTWAAADSTKLGVIEHTPDICWIGSGWKPVDLGQPDRITIELPRDGATATQPKSMSTVPFECRVFLSSDGQAREIVVWCMIVGGHFFAEPTRFKPSKQDSNSTGDGDKDLAAANARLLSAQNFAKTVLDRVPALELKQFVRLSRPLIDDWSSGLHHLKTFAADWLTIRTIGFPE